VYVSEAGSAWFISVEPGTFVKSAPAPPAATVAVVYGSVAIGFEGTAG
jgi:hypothetical protein